MNIESKFMFQLFINSRFLPCKMGEPDNSTIVSEKQSNDDAQDDLNNNDTDVQEIINEGKVYRTGSSHVRWLHFFLCYSKTPFVIAKIFILTQCYLQV